MNHSFFRLFALALTCLLASFGSAQAFGYCYDNSCINEGVDASIDFLAGYRYDKIAASVHVFDPPDNLILADDLNLKSLNIYEIGVGARILVCREWFVRLNGTFGRIKNGNYTENVNTLGDVRAISKSKVRHGNTNDFSVGAGYLFPCGCGIGVGPVAGWSYDYQRVKMGSAKTDGICDPILTGLSYKNRWQGPWIGVEAQYNCCDAWLSLGYEYHWSHWHASWTLSGSDIANVAFSDRHKSNDAFGNVIFLSGSYCLCDCWELGLTFKAQYWRVSSGRLVPRNSNFENIEISSTEVDKVHSASWHSYEALLMIGYHF